MEKIREYLLFVFIIENVAAQTSLFIGKTDIFFLGILGLGLIVSLTFDTWSRNEMYSFRWIFAISAIYLFYEFLLMPETISVRSLQYVFAKIITMIIIMVSISRNYEFYDKRIFYPLAIFLCFFVVYGLITGRGMESNAGGRFRFGYTNVNTTSWMGAMAVGMLLFAVKQWNWKFFILLCIAFYGVLAGGSRSGMLLLTVMIIVRYGLSKKIIAAVIVLNFITVYLLPTIGLKTIAVERVQNTIAGIETSNRDTEQRAAEIMISKRPWTGWGFEAKNEGQAKMISELGSHSGYLETFKFMGIPLGVLWFCIILGTILSILFWHFKHKVPLNFFDAYIIVIPICAFFEDTFTGVHEIETNFFYISLGMSSYKVACMRNGILPLTEDNNDNDKDK